MSPSGMRVALAVALLLMVCPVVSGYGKKDNSLSETEKIDTVQRRRGKTPINLKATKVTIINEFRIQVDLEWSWNGSPDQESYVEIRRENENFIKAKYPIKQSRKTSIFLQRFYKITRVRVSIASFSSNVIEFRKPREPRYLKLIRIDLNKNDETKRDFAFIWTNFKKDNDPPIYLLRNWFKHRERNFELIDGYTLWQTVNPAVEQKLGKEVWDTRVSLTSFRNKECEFAILAETQMGFSDFSDVITVDGPELPPINLSLVQISISDSDTGKYNKRNFHFEFYNIQYDNVNKIRQILFEIRIGKDNYRETWGPWQNHTPLDFSPDAKNARIVLPDYPTYELPAIQFRAMSIAYVGTSKNFSNIVTVVRPSSPPENLTLVAITRSFADREDVNYRDFEFVIDNHYYPVNKIIRLRLQYRIYKLANFKMNTAEKWKEIGELNIDSGRLQARPTISNMETSDTHEQYLRIEFRVIAVGYVGVSDPSNIAFAEVPSGPRRLNYIYYGIDVECYTKAKCKMELDFWMSRYNGTFEISDYIIQAKYYSSADKRWNWKADTVVPENGLQYKRQYIHFDYTSSYRVCARNEFGVSLPSNVLFESSNRFKTYALNVSYVRHPNDTKAINVKLFWEAFTSKDIHNYIVQSNLFFERDTRGMTNEVSVPSNVTTVEYKKNITFMRYENEKGSARGYYLPEFRVTSRRKDKTLVASSATTLLHFSYEEYKDKGDELCGCMPEKKLLVEPAG